MTEKIQKAIDKIDGEAEKANNTYARVIASHIIDNYLVNDENAEKALDKNSTLSGCIEEVKRKARKQSEGNMAMVADDEVFGWVREYYGFTEGGGTGKIIDLFDVL